GGNQVDGTAQAVTLDRRQDWLAAVIDGAEGCLQAQDSAAQSPRVAADIFTQFVGKRREHHQVDARGKVLAGTAEDHYAYVIGVVDPLEDLDDFGPERCVHGVDLVRSIDLHVSDVLVNLNDESLIVGNGRLLGWWLLLLATT